MPHPLIGIGKTVSDPPIELEVIASTLDDALAAWEGGATRLEVAIHLERGGITPSVSLVEQIVQRAPLPLRIILRDRDSFEISGKRELTILKNKAKVFANLEVNGLVMGYIKSDRMDLATLSEIILDAPSTNITVHHAIEKTSNPTEALRSLRLLPNVDRALISGGTGSLQERISRLETCAKSFGPERKIIAGGSITFETLGPLRHGTGICEFHLGRAVRTPEQPTGHVDADKVRMARKILFQPKDVGREGGRLR